MKTIVVSATALATSGALTILNEFIDYASTLAEYKFLIFVPDDIDYKKAVNIDYIKVQKKNWLARIYWDSYGLRRYINSEKIKYEVIICLQNTSLNVAGKQIIYLHQPIPFVDINIPLTSFSNFKLWLYKKFYHIFIFLFVDEHTSFIVQTEWLKQILSSKHNINPAKIIVIKPKAYFSQMKKRDNAYQQKIRNSQECNIIYPASPLLYKNHLVIVNALKILKDKKIIANIVFNVTFDKGCYPEFDKLINYYDLSSNIVYLNYLPREKLYEQYIKSSFMVFPSYAESCGLPLLEAAINQIPIIVSDLPYSREILQNYNGAIFVKYNEPEKWADAIYEMHSTNGLRKIMSIGIKNYTSDWNKLVEMIEGNDNVQK